MKTLLYLALAAAPVLAAVPVLRVQSVPHAVAGGTIRPNLIPEIAGVGSQLTGYTLPCMNCYGMPQGAILAPPPYFFITPANEPPLTFYYTVDTGYISGPGTAAMQIIETGTRKVIQSATSDITFPANSTNIISWDGAITDDDGYQGVETLVFTTSVGSVSVQTSTSVWVQAPDLVDLNMTSNNGAIGPNLIMGILGVGSVAEFPLPCKSCYGAPDGTILLPAPYYFVTPYSEPGLAFYCTLETRNLSGPGTVVFQLVEAGTGKVVESGTADIIVEPNSTNLVSFGAGVPDGNRYKGVDTLQFTATVDNASVQGHTHLWIEQHRPGN